MVLTLGEIFDSTVLKFPDKEALVDCRSNVRFTYKEWAYQVNKLANAFLQAGINKGDIVSMYLYNREELATTYFACAKIGAVFNPINFRLTVEEVSYIIEDASPKIFIYEEAMESVVRPLASRFPFVSFWTCDCDKETPSYAASWHKCLDNAINRDIRIEISEDDPYAIMYTSGTTGRPKGVIHCHRDMVEQSMIMLHALEMDSSDRGLTMAPMFHCAELHCAFLPRVHIGAANVIMHQFEAKEVLKQMEREKITIFFAAPTMWNMMLQENTKEYNLSSLRMGLYGAAPMAPSLVTEFQRVFNVKLVQAYGMTEMGPAISILKDKDQIRKTGSAGQACLNHEIRIVNPREDGPSYPEDILPPYKIGEIIVKGPCLMTGYYHNDEVTEKALYKGWYHTGDIGYMDDEGFLFVKDRVDDLIISGGENVYPREVEDVLHGHPDVLDVAVLGQPDDQWGETVTAIIIAKDDRLTAKELDDFCQNSKSLANYKRPRKYIFSDNLPRNASGKILKFHLRKQLEQNLS